jgi:hypothetical protein
VGRQIQGGERRRWRLPLGPTERHAVGLATAIRQRQADRLVHVLGRVIPRPAEEAPALAHAVAVSAIGAPARQQRLIDGGPAHTPAADGLGVVKSAWALLQ